MASSTISLCQSSIHKFITSIPSTASELAVNAVNSFIEDQVADPQKLERNFTRVRSVFSGRRPRSLEHGSLTRGDGGGDCPNSERTLLLSVPRKVRQKIWQYIDDKSVKTLRFVCHQLKHEMDYDVGLCAVLTTASLNDPWLKSISIRCCTVKQVDTILRLNHLAKPEKLEKICFDPELHIDVDMIELIIRKFRNLRQLVIFTEDVAELKSVDEEAITKEASSFLMARLEDQFQLTSMDVKFDTSKWKLKWNIKLKPQTWDKHWEIQNVMGPFGVSGIARVPCERDLSRKSLKTVTLSIPFVQDRDRYVWLRVLQAQNVLSSLTCDLNATHWKEYKVIIEANHRTLQKVFLLNVTGFDPGTRSELPIDWKMFENCQSLDEITLIADTFMRSASQTCTSVSGAPRRLMKSVNLSALQSCPVLRAMWMENFKLTDEDLLFLQQSDSATQILSSSDSNSRFELCTLKNCMVSEEEVLEVHLGRKKGRNRSLECLCFGTASYDDEDVENFEKFKATKLSRAKRCDSDAFLTDWDMIESFQNGCGIVERENSGGITRTIMGNVGAEHFNLIGGLAFTAWLYWCKS